MALKAKAKARTGRFNSKGRAGLDSLPKVPSGIQGLDALTNGGLPRGRPTLVCGGAGCGKTLFALEFLVRGASEYDEPGVFMAFEETAEDLAANVKSLGFDLSAMEAGKKLFVDHVRVDRHEVEDTGDYDLEGLFVRLKHAIDTVGAKRVVLDTVEALFSSLPNATILRAELVRLFRWLKELGMTTVITGEKGEGMLTRWGLEEYVCDCVIFLDHRVTEQTSTRRLRVVKYRGTTHGTNEYPFLIDEDGISILPISSLGLAHQASTERVSSGISRLDEMLDGKGYFKGSTVLVSGTAGSGKSSAAAILARSACKRGERCLYFAFEESPEQLVRNMRSIGVNMAPFIKQGTLKIIASRPTAQGLEMHLLEMHKAIASFAPQLVIADPITNLLDVGTEVETRSMLVRLIDFLKSRQITAFFTSLTSAGKDLEQSEAGISSLIDTWLMLEVVRAGGERNRVLSIIKSRGMAHSNQACEYRLSEHGLDLIDTYLGSSGVLTGSARVAREAEDLSLLAAHDEELERKQQERLRRQRLYESQVATLREEFGSDDSAIERAIQAELARRDRLRNDRESMRKSRQALGDPKVPSGRGGRHP
jgi:circadian clock protein KaiC